MIRVKNKKTENNFLMNMDNFKSKKLGIALITTILMTGVSTSANAEITNTAKATGTYGGVDYDSNNSSASVPVAPASRALLISSIGTPIVTISAGNPLFADVGDTVTFRYKITNNGNITENVTITGSNPTFTPAIGSAVAGTGTTALSVIEVVVTGTTTGDANDLEPTEVAVLDVSYTMTNADAYRAAGVTDGISFVATADAAAITGITDVVPVNASAATASIDAYKKLDIAKVAYLGNLTTIPAGSTAITSSTPGVAKDDYVTYEYTVTNAGNVPLTGVIVTDEHEGTNLVSGLVKYETIKTAGVLGDSSVGTTTTLNDGTIDKLAGKAVATFLYQHKVTQTEIDGQ